MGSHGQHGAWEPCKNGGIVLMNHNQPTTGENMDMPKAHNDYPKLKSELNADALRRVAEFVEACKVQIQSQARPLNCEDDSLLNMIPGDIFINYGARLDFDNPIWTGTYDVPIWSGVEVTDGYFIWRVTYDWVESTSVVEFC